MKTKSIILSGLLLLGLGASTTSCEDMFTPENKLVTTDLAPQDTVYQIMGIVKDMQKIADRTILLGELRGDLIDINEHTPTALADIANGLCNSNEAKSLENEYNRPADYYNVINSCNIYLAYVDSLLKTHGEYYYEPEIISAKTYRAWTYLELAKIYGEVPFTFDPVTTPQAAEQLATSKDNFAGMQQICTKCIADLLPYALLDRNHELQPFDYNSWRFKGKQGRFFFIPVRLMLAELYLWRGCATHSQSDFVEAVRYYHDYLTFTNEELTTGTNRIYWSGIQFSNARPSGNYEGQFEYTGSSSTYQVIIPMDTIQYYGNYSDLRSVFCASPKNKNFALVNPSRRIREISQAQDNCVYVYNGPSDIDTVSAPRTSDQFSMARTQGGSVDVELFVGDLRLNAIYTNETASSTTLMYHADYSEEEQTIKKYTDGRNRLYDDERQDFVGLYRTPIIYLHFAEALNYAGFPETAFAVLKYGLSESVLQDRTKISHDEYQRLSAIASYGFSGEYGNAAGWDRNRFRTRDMETGGFDAGGMSNYPPDGQRATQFGIHAFGSGDAFFNPNYYLPTDSSGIVEVPAVTIWLNEESTPEDSLEYDRQVQARDEALQTNEDWLTSDEVREKRQAALAKMILEEEALEGMFEGTRYYDLMRYALYTGDENFIATEVSKRKGAENAGTGELYNNFAGRQNWYLKLPKR